MDRSSISTQHVHDFSQVSTRSVESKSEAPGPFAPALNAFLTDAFQRPLSAITVSRQADTENKQLGAVANTQRQHISLSSSVTENPQDSKSMEIIAHEVSHALADARPVSLLSQSDSPVERQADVAGKSFAQAVLVGQTGFQQPLPIASGQGAVVNRYKIGSMVSQDQPVHELATLMAIKKALAKRRDKEEEVGPPHLRLKRSTAPHSRHRSRRIPRTLSTDVKRVHVPRPSTLLGTVNSSMLPSDDAALSTFDEERVDPNVQQFLRGVTWPDDPNGDLFKNDRTTERGFWGQVKAGLMHFWYGTLGVKPSKSSSLSARSHYGDLQFMHSMASSPDEHPRKTRHDILKWAEFNIRMARGEIRSHSLVRQHTYLLRLFPRQRNQTIAELFNLRDGSNNEIRQRAIGVLSHLIQDSYAEGHTERRKDNGKIKQFHEYSAQSSHKHGEKDKFGDQATVASAVRDTPGLSTAIDRTAEVIHMIDRGRSTSDVMTYLSDNVFVLSRAATRAAAGKGFEK